MSRQVIIFDLDGTLIDSREDLASAVNMMRAHFGLDALPLNVVISYIGDGMRLLTERSLNGSGILVSDALPVMKKAYAENLTVKTTLYDGVAEGLSELVDNWKLCVISNKPDIFCKKILEHLRIAEYFAFVIGGESEFPLKPDPTALKFILNKSASKPEESWILGDNHTDLEAGMRAGMKRAFATYGFGLRNGMEYDLKINSFTEFVRAMK